MTRLERETPSRISPVPRFREQSASRRRAHTKPAQVVVLAGGRGTRLAPYTLVFPKPLMPIGNQCILEIVVEQLASQGFNDIILSVGYLPHLIKAVLDNTSHSNVDITYVHEEEALGTAGPLRLVPDLDETFIVMNGDVLTTLDYSRLLRHHQKSGNVLTIATCKRTIKIQYGVLYVDTSEDGRLPVRAYEEKPETASMVSMGIYVLEPRALEYIPAGYFDFPELVQELLAAGEPIGAYVYDGLWFDIGRKDDYEKALAVWSDLKEGSLEAQDGAGSPQRLDGSTYVPGSMTQSAERAALRGGAAGSMLPSP